MKNQLLGLLLVCSSVIGYGQTLDLETCLQMADTANLQIRNARLAVASDEKQVAAYLTARLPKITATGDYKYNAIIPGQVLPAEMFGGPAGTYQTVQFGVPYNLSNTLQLTQILFNPQVNYGIAALKLNHQIVEIQQKMTERDIHEQVASTFFTLQAINKQYAFVTANIASMDKLIANMDAMQKEGMVVGTEVDKLKINRLTLMNSQQTLSATKEQLEGLFRILIGMDATAPLQLVTDEMVEQTVLVDKETVVRPELEMLEMQRKLNVEERKGTNMAYLPSLSLYGAYNYTYNMKPADDFRTGIESAMVGLRLDWTLFDGLEKMQ
ncbi:MAG: TolC family protein, partial [Fluviicola sp.]|nr:TolC family protein [Fluviicola sp.]